MKPKRIVNVPDPVLSAYMAEISGIPLLRAVEERKLLAKAKNGDREATNSIISANLRFVVAVCWNYRHRGLPLTDLINEGNLALFRAIEGFELREDMRFMSYAVWWIRRGILFALAQQAGPISYPPGRMQKAIRMRHSEDRLAQRLGGPPVREEVEAELGWSPRTADHISSVLEGMASSRGFGGSPPEPETLPSPGNEDGPEASASLALIRKALKARMESLSEDERRILSLRYGLGHGERFSAAEIGSILGISRERARQIEEHALSRLKRSTRAFLP